MKFFQNIKAGLKPWSYNHIELVAGLISTLILCTIFTILYLSINYVFVRYAFGSLGMCVILWFTSKQIKEIYELGQPEMKPCKDCNFCQELSTIPECSHPSASHITADVVYGITSTRRDFCAIQRANDDFISALITSECLTRGRNFEAK